MALFLVSSILAAPLAAATGHTELAAGIYRAFGVFCHQLPERSYYIAGHKLAVCSRCTGIYFGFAFTFLIYPLVRSLRMTELPPRRWLLLAATPLVIDFSLTFFGIWENTHTSRLLTGALLGSTAVFYVMPGIADLALRHLRYKRAAVTYTRVSAESIAAAPSDYGYKKR